MYNIIFLCIVRLEYMIKFNIVMLGMMNIICLLNSLYLNVLYFYLCRCVVSKFYCCNGLY